MYILFPLVLIKIPILLQSIEKELLERLKNGVYGDLHKDIYNYPFDKYQKVLEGEELNTEREEEEEEEDYEVFLYNLIIAFF